MSLHNAHHFVIETATMTENTTIGTQVINNSVNIQERKKSLSPVRNAPPSTSQNFTGQEEYLQKLHKHFENSDKNTRKMFVLHGMGGIGKTQICLKFKDEVSDRYLYIFWIDGTSNDTIEQGLKDIYKTYSTFMPDGMPYSSAMVLQWILMLTSEWLIIYDNADGSPDVVGKYLPPGNQGNILISSRNPEHRRIVSPINSAEVEVMNEEVAVELLLKTSGLHEHYDTYHKVALDICIKLHFLPLAIDQAGSYINSGKCSMEKYLSIYDKYRSKLMTNKNFKGASKYDKTVYGTWEISFHKIQEMSEIEDDEDLAEAAKYAIELINMCGFLYHEGISDDIFERAAKNYHHYAKTSEVDKLPMFIPTMDAALFNLDELSEWNLMKYEEAIGILMSFSLIKRTIDNARFGLHPLVQQWCRDRLPAKDQNTWMMNTRGVLSCSIRKENNFAEEIYMRTISMHVIQSLSNEDIYKAAFYNDLHVNLYNTMHANGQYRLEHILSRKIYDAYKMEYGEYNIDTITWMTKFAETCEFVGKFTEAEKLGVQLLEMKAKMLGKGHPSTLKTTGNLAKTYHSLGRLREAELLDLEVLEATTRILGREDIGTLEAMTSLADIYRSLGKLKEAELLEVQALEASGRILGKDHPNTISTMCNLAHTYFSLGKLSKAELLGMQVLEASTRILGKDHPETLKAMSNLAMTTYSLGKLIEAEILQMQVLTSSTRILGKDHPNTITCMGNLAATYFGLGKLAEAELLQVQVLEASKRIFGEEHPDTLTAMGNLALTCNGLGKLVEAELLQIQVLETNTRILGEEHLETLKSKGNLALSKHNRGKLTEAELLQIQVLTDSSRILGEEHPDTLKAAGNLALTYMDLGKLTEAESLQVQVLEGSTNILGKEHPDTLRAMGNLAGTYSKLDKSAAAELLQVQVLECSTRILGKEHMETLRAMGNLAGIYSDLDKPMQAELLEKQVLETSIRILGKDHPHTLSAMNNLAITYGSLDKMTEAELLMNQALEASTRTLGKEHPNTLSTMESLAYIYQELDKISEAEKLEVQILEIRMKSLGKNHPVTHNSLQQLVNTYRKVGKDVEAQMLEEELCEDSSSEAPSDHEVEP